jgi:myo-inositol catabolism protein IolC
MNLTIGQLLNAKPALEKLFSQELPSSTAFKLARLTRELNNALEAFDDVRKKVIAKYNPDNKEDLSADTQKAIISELNEAAAESVTISFEPIPLNAFEGTSMTASDAMALDFLIKDD